MQGTIQRLIRGKGFGFILADDRQYFFHHSAVRDIEFKQLTLGDVVEFQSEADEQDRNPRAVDIVVIEKKERVPKPPPAKPAPRAPRKPAPRGRRPPAAGGPRDRRQKWPAAARHPAEADFGGEPPDEDAILRDFGAAARDGDGEFVEEFPSAGPLDEPRPRPRRPAPGRGGARGGPGKGREGRRPRASGAPGARGEGVVRALDHERGFGFIETSGGDIFFHRTAVTDGFEHLNVGSRVAFVFGQGDRGSKAESVSAL
jgi:cold shock CspA family protein